MRAARSRVVPGLLAAFCAASLAWAAEPTSPQTKAEMIRLIDTLARLCLGLQRQGRTLRVEGASPRLRSLLGLCGLSSVITCQDIPSH